MASWEVVQRSLSSRIVHAQVRRGGVPATFAQVIAAWQCDEEFRDWFNQGLADSPFAAFRWETPAVVQTNLDRPFEFVVLDSPGLATRPVRHSFADQFRLARQDESVVTFANLGKNAVLVAPCPVGADDAYAHLGDFVRYAPAAQRSQLWQQVGEAMAQRVSERPVWLSTAGAGVAWLHVRLDDSPKYYQHEPYRALPR